MREVTSFNIQKESEVFKDKPYDLSSKFMGTLAEEKNKPWYLRDAKPESEKKVTNTSEQSQLGNNIYRFTKKPSNYYMILDVKSRNDMVP